MKKLLSLFALLLAVQCASGQDIKALDEKNGFRDARFGTDTTSFKDLVYLTTSQDGLRYYKRTADSPTIGNATTVISYGFYKGRLMAVIINAAQGGNYLLDALKTSYGAGYQSNKYIPEYTWLGQQVYMVFKENAATHQAQATLISRPMIKQKELDDRSAAEKAKSDL